MNRLEDSVKKLREIECRQAELLENIRLLRELIAEDERKMEVNERIADSYRTVIAHEAGEVNGGENFVAITKAPLVDSYSEALRAAKPSRHGRRTASSLLKLEFKGVRQNDIVKRILLQAPTKTLRTDEIVEKAYDCKTLGDLKKAKSTMASVLSRGVTKGLWHGGAGTYSLREDVEND